MMKSSFPPIKAAVLLAALFLGTSAMAADPVGTWKWTMTMGGGGGQVAGGGGAAAAGGGGAAGGMPAREVVLKIKKEGDVLSGTVSGRMGDTPIKDPAVKDDTLTFTVTRERNGQTITQKYSGKIEGDKITGTIEGTGMDGQPTKRDWTANRAKDDATPTPTP